MGTYSRGSYDGMRLCRNSNLVEQQKVKCDMTKSEAL